MNRRKKLIRYKRLHDSQHRRILHKDPENVFLLRTARVLIATRKRVAPWHVVPKCSPINKRIVGFEII